VSASITIPEQYSQFIAVARSLAIPGLELRELPLVSVAQYSTHERVPNGFPRPSEHMVIADYLIDLPVVALDCAPISEHYGRVLAYSHGDYWVAADRLSEFTRSLEQHDTAALFGEPAKA
jgi:hypothetical protein